MLTEQHICFCSQVKEQLVFLWDGRRDVSCKPNLSNSANNVVQWGTNKQAVEKRLLTPCRAKVSRREGGLVLPKAVTVTTLHITEVSASAQPLSQSGWFWSQGGNRQRISGPVPFGAELAGHRQLQTELPVELVSFCQSGHWDTVSRPYGSVFRLCWPHFVYLKPKTMTGAWLV